MKSMILGLLLLGSASAHAGHRYNRDQVSKVYTELNARKAEYGLSVIKWKSTCASETGELVGHRSVHPFSTEECLFISFDSQASELQRRAFRETFGYDSGNRKIADVWVSITDNSNL